ncbi:hypothetical protein P154DRAFT_577388 [Amniculicola lignicola CBS 123094]|uniref:Uncharacterized protein n=1 Tax=Amniculicola lignicola CBS 123094 TaxID=1392246 RepID=A0A6A5WDX7_9PLEO|nr:hypothetical protein P154DRAFT_577388 [Amniculicola lignicola CBS 123094]
MWTVQLPFSEMEPKPLFKLSEAIKPAKMKDAIRSAVGVESGQHLGGEVVLHPPSDLQIPEGKLHPELRGWFGCDVMQDGKSVCFWGGVNAKGEQVGDGWAVRLE